MGHYGFYLSLCLATFACGMWVAAESSDLVEIAVGDEVFLYSMSVDPPVDSPVVKRETEELLGSLDLESFVKDLSRVAKYIRVAYNGIGAAGPKFQDLQNEVQRLGFDISKLCDKSAVTIASYKTTTRTVLYELKSTYEFLVENMEVMAIDSFKTLGELAGKMAKAAEDLRREFEKQEAKVIDTWEHTMSRKSKEKIRVSDLKEQQKKTDMKAKEQERLAKEHEKLEAEFRAERHRYEAKEDKALSSKSGFLRGLGNIITSSFGLGNLFGDDSAAASRANQWRQKSIAKLENEKEQRKLKHEALQSMAELVHGMKHMGEEAELSEVAVDALHKASGTLRQLIVLLKQAALFWNQLKTHCLGIADDKLQQQIELFVEKYSKDERKKYWTSRSFKQRMFLYITKWVALYSVSSDYLKQIKLTQRELYDYIEENPTYEDSKRDLKKLVADFEKDLKSAEERIKEQDFKTDTEIKQLKAEQKADEQKTEL